MRFIGWVWIRLIPLYSSSYLTVTKHCVHVEGPGNPSTCSIFFTQCDQSTSILLMAVLTVLCSIDSWHEKRFNFAQSCPHGSLLNWFHQGWFFWLHRLKRLWENWIPAWEKATCHENKPLFITSNNKIVFEQASPFVRSGIAFRNCFHSGFGSLSENCDIAVSDLQIVGLEVNSQVSVTSFN